MVWKPTKVLGAIVGLIILLTIVGVDRFLIENMFNQGLSLNLYFTALLFILSLPIVAIWLYWYIGFLTLRYHMDRNALTIVSATGRQVIPLQTIQRIVAGHELTVSQNFRGIGWPGYLKGTMRLKGLGMVWVHSTEPLERQLVVVTDTLSYGISPMRRQEFLEDFEARRSLGPIRELHPELEPARLVTWPIWHDRWLWAILLVAMLGNAALFGFIAGRWGDLPERLPLHFDAQGIVDRIDSKNDLLLVPAIGALTLLTNTVLGILLHRQECLGSFLLAFSAMGIQCILWVATLGILANV
jgi:hypothetical protein